MAIDVAQGTRAELRLKLQFARLAPRPSGHIGLGELDFLIHDLDAIADATQRVVIYHEQPIPEHDVDVVYLHSGSPVEIVLGFSGVATSLVAFYVLLFEKVFNARVAARTERLELEIRRREAELRLHELEEEYKKVAGRDAVPRPKGMAVMEAVVFDPDEPPKPVD